MARLRSPTRTISNSGDVPRFTGVFPTSKAPEGKIVYDSIAALYVAVFLEWCRNVRQIIFEKDWCVFEATHGLAAVRCLPDFDVVLDGGELLTVEAKSSKAGLSDEVKAELALIERHFAARNRKFTVMFHDDLKRDGFIETIFLLRPYGLLEFRGEILEKSHARLMRDELLYLEDWRAVAMKNRVPIAVLYHLLYQQRLPIKYRMILHPELNRWRV